MRWEAEGAAPYRTMIATASDRRAEIGRARDGNARLEELARSGTRDACPYRPPYRQKLRLGCVPRQSRLPGTGAGTDALYRRRRLAQGRRSGYTPARRFHAVADSPAGRQICPGPLSRGGRAFSRARRRLDRRLDVWRRWRRRYHRGEARTSRHGAEPVGAAARLPQRRGGAGPDVDQRRQRQPKAAGLCLPSERP